MIKTLCNKLLLVLYYIIGALVLEALTFHILGFGVFPQYFLYNLSVIVCLAFFVYIIPNYVAQYVVFTILLFIQTILAYVNYSLYIVYGDLFSLDMLRLISDAFAAMSSSFVYISVIFQLVGVYISIAIVGGLILKKCRKQKIETKDHFSILIVVMLLFVQSFGWAFYFNKRANVNSLAEMNSANYINSDTFLLNTEVMKVVSYKKFGTFGYASNLVANYNKKLKDSVEDICIDYFNSGSIYNGQVYEDNTTVHGVDKDNNLIVIMMESTEWFGFGDGNYDYDLQNLSKDLTPNVYGLIYGEDVSDSEDDSLVATRFFAKSKTNISEGYGVLGNYPVGKLFTDIAGANYNKNSNAFGYSLPSIMAKNGYITSYVHSNNIQFYNRDKTHNNLGFENVIGKNDYYTDMTFGHWVCETDFVENAMPYIVPEGDQPFFTFYLNVSSHGTYDNNKYNMDRDKYKQYVMYGIDDCYFDETTNKWEFIDVNSSHTFTDWYKNILKNYNDADFVNQLVNYECGIVALDDAIGKIINELKVQGKYDNTTLVLYSDHYSYYDNMSNKFKDIPVKDLTNIEANTIPMIISSPGLKSNFGGKYTWNDRFCSAYDLIPTILDLFGIPFNENFYIGNSLFKVLDSQYTDGGVVKDMTIYYSNTGGIFSQNIYTYDMVHFSYFNTFDFTMEEFDLLKQQFTSEATKTLLKINYLNILNKYYLYDRVTNI